MKPKGSLHLACLLALAAASGCGGRTSLDAFDGGIPAPPDLAGGDGVRVGDPCDSAEACADGQSCEGSVRLFRSDVTLPEGYCTVVGCRDEADCGAEADCVRTADDSACLRTCEDDFDCRIGDGYVCASVRSGESVGPYCLPGR